MGTKLAPLPSLDGVVDRVITHLEERRDTALISAPGSGATTLVELIKPRLIDLQIDFRYFDLTQTRSLSKTISELSALQAGAPSERQFVLIMDHAACLRPDDLKAWVEIVSRKALSLNAACLWVGSLDARVMFSDYGIRINASPKSHISFPVPARDELLAAYRAIAETNGCRWGESIHYLLLDFCGNDFSLIRDLTDYLHGDWTSKLYDVSIWDRMSDWLSNDPRVDTYRQAMNELPEECRKYLSLTCLGGKPPCPRMELLEEVDSALRELFLKGFLVHNLLPGFYQLRNLTIMYLVQEHEKPRNGCRPEMLFRRATNERASRLLQDVEIMLRSIVLTVFQRLGEGDVRNLLERKQSDRVFIPSDLNIALLEWASKAGGPTLKQDLNSLILQHRNAFRVQNSVWARVNRMVAGVDLSGLEQSVPTHLHAVEYLTLTELGGVLLDLFEEVFSAYKGNEAGRNRLKATWQEYISKLSRLRNDVAHLRNVGFQDMQDLVGTVEKMRIDLIEYTGWR